MGCLPWQLAFSLAGGGDESDDSVQQQLLKNGTHDTSLPAPGELVFHDFRTARVGSRGPPVEKPLRVVQWNVERGYEIEGIIDELRQLDADIIALQEIDIGCDRSNNRDVGVEIARQLGMNYVFLCEFTELRSTKRSALAQGGGCHGNGIMTRFDIMSAECIRHGHHPVPWESDDHVLSRQEPRVGERVTLAATVSTSAGPVITYSAHLEVFTGALGRMRQFADILQHSRLARAQGTELQLICGDLNTMGHGVARLSPFHCTDHLRWRTLGKTEAQVWQENVFDVREGGGAGGPRGEADDARCKASPPRNERVWALGLHDEDVCRALLNPGFEEVFPVDEETLDHPSFRVCGISLMSGKLDWLLHRGGFAVSKRMVGNNLYSASDHKWLAADLELAPVRHTGMNGKSDDATNNVPVAAATGTSPPLRFVFAP